VSDPVAGPTARALPDSAYRRMAFVLRAGLLASLALLAGAIVAFWVRNAGESASSAINHNPILPLLSVQGLAGGLGAGDPAAFLTLGLVVLVATPLLRVACGFYYFERGGERAMALITITVLVLLLFGLLVLGPLIR
jgi:uncharacterized membrane protein